VPACAPRRVGPGVSLIRWPPLHPTPCARWPPPHLPPEQQHSPPLSLPPGSALLGQPRWRLRALAPFSRRASGLRGAPSLPSQPGTRRRRAAGLSPGHIQPRSASAARRPSAGAGPRFAAGWFAPRPAVLTRGSRSRPSTCGVALPGPRRPAARRCRVRVRVGGRGDAFGRAGARRPGGGGDEGNGCARTARTRARPSSSPSRHSSSLPRALPPPMCAHTPSPVRRAGAVPPVGGAARVCVPPRAEPCLIIHEEPFAHPIEQAGSLRRRETLLQRQSGAGATPQDAGRLRAGPDMPEQVQQHGPSAGAEVGANDGPRAARRRLPGHQAQRPGYWGASLASWLARARRGRRRRGAPAKGWRPPPAARARRARAAGGMGPRAPPSRRARPIGVPRQPAGPAAEVRAGVYSGLRVGLSVSAGGATAACAPRV
jgi:hypothetical protein